MEPAGDAPSLLEAPPSAVPDGTRVSGLTDELTRAAVIAQVRSGGRKPSRYS